MFLCVRNSVCFWQVAEQLSGQYLVKLRSGWGLLPLLRSQREEAESRGGRAEQEEEVELRRGCGVGRLFLLLKP